MLNPSINERWDNSEWYKKTTSVVDGISLVGVGVSVAATVRILSLLSKSRVKVSKALSGTVSRQGRARVAKESARFNNPGISNKTIKQMQRSEKINKRFTNTHISQNSIQQLKDAVGATLSFSASGLDGDVKKAVVYLLELE